MAVSDDLEAHETINWIMKNADSGFFIITAPIGVQNELALYYKTPDTAIFDYAENVSSYSYSALSDFSDANPGVKFLFILNMQLALDNDESMLLFNMSRDLLKKKKKAWFFFMTTEAEYRLSTFAFDIYSHVLQKVYFTEASVNDINIRRIPFIEKNENMKKSREALKRYNEMEAKLMSLSLDETPDYRLLSAAIALSDISKLHIECAEYEEALEILKFINAIRSKILGCDHPDTIKSYDEMQKAMRGLKIIKDKTDGDK